MTDPVRIVRIAAGGDGVGRAADGRVVFVPRTAPGDLVELRAVRDHRRFARARVGRLIEPGPGRAEPRCPHYTADECGGCQLQHLAYPAQLDARRALVGDALRRIAGRDLADPPIDASGRTYDYRTKITLAASGDGRSVGLHPLGRPDRVFDLSWCHITAPALMRLWEAARAARRLLPRGVEQLVLRLDRGGGAHLLARVRGSAPWRDGRRLRAELDRRGAPATVWWQPTGGAARAMAGTGEAYPVTSFEQVHPEMAERVRSHAVASLGDVAGRHVWDLYAGVGDTTAALAAAGAGVESVEADPRAVAEAESRGPRARRHAGRVEDVLHELRPPDVVLTNPPRTGMDERVTAALDRLGPERVVYVSCDPATLARDVARLRRFRVASVRAFDLFPQTAHVETVAVLERT